jgi:hypothetical protein
MMRLEVQSETRGDTTYLKCPLCRHTLVTDGASLIQHLQSVHRTSVQWKQAVAEDSGDASGPEVAEIQATRGNRQARRGSLKQADTPPVNDDQSEPSSDEQTPA